MPSPAEMGRNTLTLQQGKARIKASCNGSQRMAYGSTASFHENHPDRKNSGKEDFTAGRGCDFMKSSAAPRFFPQGCSRPAPPRRYRKARAFAEKRRALSCGLRALPRPGHPAGGVRSRSTVAPAGTSAGRLFRHVPRACPFRMAPALYPNAGASAPARFFRHACPLWKHAQKRPAPPALAPALRLPCASLPPSLALFLPPSVAHPVALGIRPCRACAEYTPFFAKKAFDFHGL